ncbi:MAG: SPOR domain-containing protein [Bryobacterales bacterium]|nr:SPOR domain-containing protein [Bryobacterales bacterium]
MPSPQDEEFELVLGNKQLLSLFFVVVVLFAVFFSFGYTVGFSRGQQDRVMAATSSFAPEPEVADVRIPDTLLEDAPKPREVLSPPPPVKPEPSEPAAKPAPPPEKVAAPAAPAAATGAQIARGIHVQVAALRVRSDAQLLVSKLKDKQYPVALYDKGGDGWHRVVVGPFASVNEAKDAQNRMRADGLQTILRRP